MSVHKVIHKCISILENIEIEYIYPMQADFDKICIRNIIKSCTSTSYKKFCSVEYFLTFSFFPNFKGFKNICTT